MTHPLKIDAGGKRCPSDSRQSDTAIGIVCMALALASVVLLVRAVGLL